MWFLSAWLGSIALGTALAAVLPRTAWWVGTVSTALLGPLGLVLVAVDVATYRERTSSPS